MLSFAGVLAVKCVGSSKQSAKLYAWLSDINSFKTDLVGNATSWRCQRNLRDSTLYNPSIYETAWLMSAKTKKLVNSIVPRTVKGMVVMRNTTTVDVFICRKFISCKENSIQSLLLGYYYFFCLICCQYFYFIIILQLLWIIHLN